MNVYAVPFVNPDTPIGEDPALPIPPGEDIAVKVVAPVPAAPAVYVTDAVALPAVAVPIVGAPGRSPAVAEFDAAEVAEPYAVDAVTVTVYAVPAVRPVI
jgi:hypothetical protein